jgi:hypothetical protein
MSKILQKSKRKITIDNVFFKIKETESLSGIVRSINMYDDILNIIIERTNYLQKDVKICERLYHIKNEIFEVKQCPICGEILKLNKKNFYNKTCSKKECIKKYVQTEVFTPELRELISLQKHELNKKLIIEDYAERTKKMKATLIEHWGTDSYAKTQEFKDFMMNNFGYVSPFELKETHEKSKQTLIDRTGYDHNFKIPEVQKQIKQTFIKKYGFEHATQNEEIKQKIINTNNKEYGGNSPMCNKEIQLKAQKTLMTNYGVTSPLLNNEILQKYKDTMMRLYDIEFWIQNVDNYEELLKYQKETKYKKYFLPNGEIVYLQGYEDYVLEKLLLKYKLNDILIRNRDITKYIGKIFYDYNLGEHKYYPDFYIKSENLIIEVKSEYTYNVEIEKNNLKKEACLKNNLNFEFYIISKKEYQKWKINKNKK